MMKLYEPVLEGTQSVCPKNHAKHKPARPRASSQNLHIVLFKSCSPHLPAYKPRKHYETSQKNLKCPARRYKVAWKDWADLKTSAKRAKVFWSVKGETAVSRTQFLFTSFFLRPKPEGLATSWFSSPFLLGASPHSLVNVGRSSVPVRVWLKWYQTGIFAAIWTSTVCFPICNHFPSMSSTSQPSPTGQHISRTPFYACCTSQYVGKTTQILPQLFLEKMSRESSATPTSSSTPTSSPQKLKLFHGDLEINSIHLYSSLPNKLKMVKATLSHWFENHTAESSDTWRFADVIIVS